MAGELSTIVALDETAVERELGGRGSRGGGALFAYSST
jgi:hypothetical protein